MGFEKPLVRKNIVWSNFYENVWEKLGFYECGDLILFHKNSFHRYGEVLHHFELQWDENFLKNSSINIIRLKNFH